MAVSTLAADGVARACVSGCDGHKEKELGEADAGAGATTFRPSFFAFD